MTDEQLKLKQKLMAMVREALRQKLLYMEAYIDSMIADADGQSPAECGLDPEHNVEEFIKDLQDIQPTVA